MSRGYIALAQNTPKINYLDQAYALALNLKITQNTVSNFSVCVNPETKKMITQKHKDVFDNIIDIPWGDSAQFDDKWKIHNKWKFYYMTPYDETVILDTDMIFPQDISHWWDILIKQDVWATTTVKNFQGDTITSNYYRKVFESNNLPNVYMAFFYFKKSDLASELFAMIEIIFQHWQRMFFKYLPKNTQPWLSGDVAFALAMQLLGIENLCTNNTLEIPTFVHMKSHAQSKTRYNINDNWMLSLPTYYNNCTDFKIGNYQQYLPFHYTEKDWMTQDKILQMEKMI